MGRAAVAAHEDLEHGLNTLATIASIAPFVGVFGTVSGIAFDTFRSVGPEKSVILAMLAEGLSRACLPMALGLLVGLQSLWCYRYFRGRLADFDHKMEDASLKLVNQLTLQLGHLSPASPIEPISQSLPYLETYSVSAGEQRRCWRRSTLAAVELLVLAWGIE